MTPTEAAQDLGRSRTGRGGAVRVKGVLAIVAVAMVMAGCSEEAALSTIPSLPPTSGPLTAPPAPTDPTAGSDGTASAASPPPTGATPPATESATTSTTVPPEDDLEQLRKEVERDFLRNQDLLSGFARRPREGALAGVLREAVVPGSELFKSDRRLYRSMIARGQRIKLGNPPLAEFVVEKVEFSGEAPHTEAVVTYCTVTNASLVAVAPNGDLVHVGPRVGVRASRAAVPMRLMTGGWKEYEVVESTDGYWEGATSCPDG